MLLTNMLLCRCQASGLWLLLGLVTEGLPYLHKHTAGNISFISKYTNRKQSSTCITTENAIEIAVRQVRDSTATVPMCYAPPHTCRHLCSIAQPACLYACTLWGILQLRCGWTEWVCLRLNLGIWNWRETTILHVQETINLVFSSHFLKWLDLFLLNLAQAL